MSEELDELQRAVLRTLGLKAYDAGLAPVPWRVRLWRRVTFAYRRGKAVDWRSYNEAWAQAKAEEVVFEVELPGRAQAIADAISEVLPEGMRFEWTTEGEA